MCLRSTHGSVPKTAKKDIYVFKVLAVDIKEKALRYRGPYYYSEWKLGVVNKSTLKVNKQKNWQGKIIAINIEEGLHAVREFKNTRRHIKVGYYCRTFVYVALIPKGSKYFLGNKGDIASNRMMVLPHDHPESMKRLRISGHIKVV